MRAHPAGKLGEGATAVTGADIVSNLAKTLTGSALVLLGFSLASMGHLVGKAPEDDKEKEFWEQLGHQEYSLEYGGKSYTLDWLAPESIPLFLGANLHAAALSKGLTLKEALEAVGSITDPMLQMSMLQGVNDALENASTYGDESALPRFVENAMWGYLTQFVPTLAGQVNRSINNQRMSTYVDKNKDIPDFWQKLSGKLTGKIPGLNNITGAQIAYIDAWGRTEKNADTATENVLSQLFSPGYPSTIEETDMEKELLRLYESTGKKSVLISRADKYFNVNGGRVDLTGAQYLTYAQTRGQTAFRLMNSLTGSAAYRAMDDEQKVKAIRKYTDYAFVVDDLSEEALTEVGIQNCGTVGICIGEQIDISILTSMLVLNMGVPHVIAKASSPGHGEVLKRLGVTVVYPEADMAVRIGKRLISGNLLDYIALEDGVEVQRIQVNGKMLNKSIRELDIRRLYGINIIAIERDHRTDVEFSPDSRFQNGDTILVIGKSEKIDRFERSFQD